MIKNVNRNVISQSTRFAKTSDVVSQYIPVPCGRCAVCLALKQNYLTQRVLMESLENLIFFGTLTYNNETLPSINVNGYNIKYADILHFQNMVRYIRKHESLPKFRYFACSEFGSKRHRPHWHFLLTIPKSFVNTDYDRILLSDLVGLQEKWYPIFLEYWRHNIGTRKFPVWRPNCNFSQRGKFRNYDFQYVDTLSKSSSDVAFYVSKYVTKSSKYIDDLKSALFFNLPDDQFSSIWNMVKPRFLYSKFFGDPKSSMVAKHILDGVRISLCNDECIIPQFVNPHTGVLSPLSPYYQRKFIDADTMSLFISRRESLSSDCVISNSLTPITLSPEQIIQKENKWKHVQDLINIRDFDLFSFLDSDFDYNVQSFIDSTDYGLTKISSLVFDTSESW